MDTTKLIELLPGVLILISVMTISIIILAKFGDKLFDKDYKTANILLIITAFLFIIILIVHLLREQPWTADTLKILIGVLLGTGSAKVADKNNEEGNSIDVSGGSSVGGDVAGRDINKNIQNIQEAISTIQHSIIHQNNQIKQFVKQGSTAEDFVFHFLYYKQTLNNDIELVVTNWTANGYQFKEIVSDFHGFDGMILIFSRLSESTESSVHYYRDRTFEIIKKEYYDQG